ncbi:Uncharacterised protein [uncultured Flavonifractor sp.]|nr:Uncharacterised protein [Flavonifractor plautii]SCJ50796.1 Uncharacterised protein [uncultured Flavonifractor sp.]
MNAARAGEMDKSKFAPAVRCGLQQRQCHGLAPCCGIAAGGAGLIQTADHVSGSLVDRLTPPVLFELPPLILPQEQRRGLRCCQHGKFRGDGTGEVPPQLQRILLTTAIGVAIVFSLREDIPESTKVLGDIPQFFALPHKGQKLRVDGVFLHTAGIIPPCGEDALHLFGFFRGGGHRLLDKGSYSLFVFRCGGIHQLAYGLYLTAFAFGAAGSSQDGLLQRSVLPFALSHPLQQGSKVVLRLLLCQFQLFQCLQCALFTAQSAQQTIQFPGGAGDKFRRRLVGGQLPPLTDVLEGGIVLAASDVVEDVGVECSSLCGQFRFLPAFWHQGIEGLVNIPGQCREGAQLFPGRLLNGVQSFITIAQVCVDAVLQFCGPQHPVGQDRCSLCRLHCHPRGT